MTPSILLPAVASIARQAGAILREGFGGVIEASNKEGQHNLVTAYDVRVEQFLLEQLSTLTPGAAFLGEEGGKRTGTTNFEWVVDPLDGTVNFAHGIPIFCVSIGLRIDGRLCLGVIYQPLLDEMFTACLGCGAFLNDKPIRVSTAPDLASSLLVTGFPYNVASNPHQCIEQFSVIVGKGLPIRRLGSAALDLAYTAAGRFDGFWEVSLNEWDMAAGVVILTEAGGRVTHYENRPFALATDSIIATNGQIHDELASFLKVAEQGKP